MAGVIGHDAAQDENAESDLSQSRHGNGGGCSVKIWTGDGGAHSQPVGDPRVQVYAASNSDDPFTHIHSALGPEPGWHTTTSSGGTYPASLVKGEGKLQDPGASPAAVHSCRGSAVEPWSRVRWLSGGARYGEQQELGEEDERRRGTVGDRAVWPEANFGGAASRMAGDPHGADDIEQGFSIRGPVNLVENSGLLVEDERGIDTHRGGCESWTAAASPHAV